MKNTFLFALICSASFSLAAYAGNPNDNNTPKALFTMPEKAEKKFSIGLSVGTTIPLQDYSSTTANVKDSTHIVGSAKIGIHFNVTAGYKFSKYVGAMLMVGGNINSYSPGTSPSIGSSSVVTPSGPHYIGQYLIGPYFSYPIGKKLSMEVRALAGLMTSAYPKLSTTESVSASFLGSYSISTNEKLKPGMAFGYSGGIGAKYMLSEHIAVTLNGAYSGSNMAYKGGTNNTVTKSSGYLSSTIPSSNTTTTSTNTIHMAVGMINVTAGISYFF